MEQQEKIEQLEEWLDTHHVRYETNRAVEGYSLFIYIPNYRIAVPDFKNHGEQVLYKICRYAKMNPIFVRDDETADFIIEKTRNTINRLKEARRKQSEKRYRREICQKTQEFLKKGIWHKLDWNVKFNEYNNKPENFYLAFMARMESEFDGNYEKTVQSFVEKFDKKYRPKPKPKRKRVRIIHAEKIEPHGKRA